MDEYEKISTQFNEGMTSDEKIDMCGLGIDYLDKIKRVCILGQDQINLITIKNACIKQHEILLNWVNSLLMDNRYLIEKYELQFKAANVDFINEMRTQLMQSAME